MEKILIIDDDAAYQKVVETLLRTEGYRTCIAPNGKEGFESALREHPDLIFLDMMMPGEHGFKALQKFQEHAKTKDIPIIIVTNLATAEPLANGYDTAAFFIKSQTSNEVLVATVRNILQEYKKRS